MFTNTINFDVHINQVFPPLTAGASLVVAKPEGHLDAVYVVDLMLSTKATGFMFTVPTLVSVVPCSVCRVLAFPLFAVLNSVRSLSCRPASTWRS